MVSADCSFTSTPQKILEHELHRTVTALRQGSQLCAAPDYSLASGPPLQQETCSLPGEGLQWAQQLGGSVLVQ